ncbi:hypothetical protein GAO09_23570 [Rhizobiales bacterium RZME27]|jgi:hypothetical protein|uniref:Uncharacterized protein n=1 Tax=Endobacterium cereale TaxID=2663029 RepID=A0A6A8AGT4_9HYPH|nr:DUF6065 family protein [Endobacterium cereale]MQY49017.1 hypothetical protein [Endobacterium cereale]
MTTLKAFVLDGHDVRIRPAPVEREWMDETGQRFAYRCLPLNIANAHGWELLNPVAFSVTWNGQQGKNAIQIRTSKGHISPAVSHFGHGILTFHVPCLFQTEPGVDLFISGPINRPKDGIAALTGVIETDWSPYTFTMNWKMTRPFQRVFFEMDEPFCHLFPVVRSALSLVEPEIANLSENAELQREHFEWIAERNAFNSQLLDPNSTAASEKWQKSYFRGVNPSGSLGSVDHVSRLRLKPFAEK